MKLFAFALIAIGELAYGQIQPEPQVIGMARSWGAFVANNASVPGTAALFDGTRLKTLDASSDLVLSAGERVSISSNSSAIIHPDYLRLDRGTVEFTGTAGYRVEARGLRIDAGDSAAHVRVALDSGNRVMVSSVGSATEIRNGQNILVARVLPGSTLTLAFSGSSK